MSLLVPLGLLALLSLPVIVVLHMRNVTPQPRPIPSLRFWLAAEPRTTEQTRFRRPPITLLLILQLLIAAALALALARPATSQAMAALGLSLRSEPRHLILLIDGSTSMSALDTPDGRSRFEAARTEALRELADLREGDVASVLVLGTRTLSFSATDAASLGALRDRIAAVTPPGGRADLDAALALAHDLLLPGLDDRVSIVTDGAVAADPGTADRLGAPVELHLVGSAATGAAAPNAAVVDLASRADPDHPAQRQLYARLLNFGPDAVTAPVTLSGDGLEVSRQTVTLPPNGGSTELTWALPQGAQRVSVRLEANDALPADNTASLVVQGAAGNLGLDILLVSDAPAALQRALAALPGAEVTSVPTDGFASATAGHAYDLLVFDRTAPPDAAAQPAAPMLFVDPPAGGPFATNGVMTDPTVDRLRAQDPLLQGVDLAGATFGAAPIYQLDRGEDEVVGASQGPLVFRGRVGPQPAIVLAFDLTQSNLPQRVAFPILIANAVGELAPNPL
ncbi:MAG TPA: VWA domain-containing protein, partial [Thermomicrobiales bacterium]|nr:VWA domain-containing protein [Thermomicrobiales bacterium]